MHFATTTHTPPRRQPLPPGTCWLLVSVAGIFLAGLLLQVVSSRDVASWLALSPAQVWQGQIWRLLTHAFLAGDLLGLILGLLSIAWLGAGIERTWSRNELLSYVCICAFATGVIRCLVAPAATTLPGGLVVLIAALLVAWTRLAPRETVHLPGLGSLSRAVFALILAGLSLLLALFQGGLSIVMQGLLAASIGWLYLSARWRWLASRAPRSSASQRLRRLEL